MSYRSINKVSENLTYDEGLRRFMQGVFNNMGMGLLISAVVSFFVGTNPELLKMFFGGAQKWIVIFAPLVMVIALSAGIHKMRPETARMVFFAYAAIMGLSLSTIFAVYKIGSVATVFFATSATFGAMAIYGHTTQRNLTDLGSFLIMGVFGLIIAGIINIFVGSTVLTTAISILSVFIFTGLTAYDVQQLRVMYDSLHGVDRDRYAIIGALQLYLDFINIFISLLNLFGERD